MRKCIAVFLLVASSALAAPSSARRSPVVQVVDKVSPAVVNISAEQFVRQRRSLFEEFFGEMEGWPGRTRKAQSLGSGVIIDPRGIILTNDHVISGASRIVATTKSGEELDCELVGSDSDSDLAVLRVKSKRGGLPTIPIGTSSDLMIGETVVAIGNPFGFKNTVTVGVVSALGRSVPSETSGRTYTDFVQIDAPINPGNSGGPLVNIDGELVGINTAIIGGAQGIGFAIPVDRARRIVKDILSFGKVRPAWIGVRGRTLASRRSGEGAPRGFLIRSVFPGSPAAQAELKSGDVIVAVEGRPVDSREAFDTALSTIGPGQPIALTAHEGGQERKVTLRAAAPPGDLGERILRAEVGLSVESARSYVQIVRVERNSAGDRAGLEAADAIVGVNGEPVRSVRDLNQILERDFNRTTLILVVERGRWQYTLTFPLD